MSLPQTNLQRKATNDIELMALYLTKESEIILRRYMSERTDWNLLPYAIPGWHCSLAYRPTQDQIDEIAPLLGHTTEILVDGFASHRKIQALSCEILDHDIARLCNNQVPHITVYTDGKTPPFYSNGLLEFSEFEKLKRPFILKCVVGQMRGNRKDVTSKLLSCQSTFAELESRVKSPVRKVDKSVDKIIGNAGKVYSKIRKAIAKDDVSTMRKLLPKSSDGIMHAKDFRIWPKQGLLLMAIAKSGALKCLRYIIEELGFNINRHRPKDLCTALHVAAFYHGQAVIKELIRINADPLVTNAYGEIPKISSDVGNVVQSKRCLQYGLKPDLKKLERYMNESPEVVRCDNQRTPYGSNLGPLCPKWYQATPDITPPQDRIYSRQESWSHHFSSQPPHYMQGPYPGMNALPMPPGSYRDNYYEKQPWMQQTLPTAPNVGMYNAQIQHFEVPEDGGWAAHPSLSTKPSSSEHTSSESTKTESPALVAEIREEDEEVVDFEDALHLLPSFLTGDMDEEYGGATTENDEPKRTSKKKKPRRRRRSSKPRGNGIEVVVGGGQKKAHSKAESSPTAETTAKLQNMWSDLHQDLMN